MNSLRTILPAWAVFIGACAFNHDHPYPASWPPLPAAETGDCSDLGGTYADRGQTDNFPSVNPSLTFNLGWEQGWTGAPHREDWKSASRVTLSANRESLEAVVWDANGEQIANRTFTRASGHFVCESGRATLEWHVFEGEDVATAREDYTVESVRAGDYLVAHVRDRAIGTIFLVFPVWGTDGGWVRFERLSD